MNLIDIKDFLQRAAERIGFSREKYEDRKLPNDVANITVMPFFGDMRATFVLSSLLLKRYQEEVKGSKYFIFCSWPGYQSFFPYVDEYWALTDTSQIKKLYQQSEGFRNRADVAAIHLRNMHEFFREVTDVRDLQMFYNNGITQKFWDRFKHVKRFLPMVPSSAILGKDFNRELTNKAGYKVFLSPSQFICTWKLGKPCWIPASKLFWIELIKRLLAERFTPVLWKHDLAHDLSMDFPEECIHVAENDVARILGVMRAVGCVLDVFNGSSKLALAARCPFVSCDERQRYIGMKEYEIDDLCGSKVPKQYIFSFATIIEDSRPGAWNAALFSNIVARLNAFMPELNRDEWPSTAESLDIVSYDTVRKHQIKRIGAKLLKITKD